MSRLRTLNTGADESTAADTWRDALEMKAALAWSAAGTLTAAAGMILQRSQSPGVSGGPRDAP